MTKTALTVSILSVFLGFSPIARADDEASPPAELTEEEEAAQFDALIEQLVANPVFSASVTAFQVEQLVRCEPIMGGISGPASEAGWRPFGVVYNCFSTDGGGMWALEVEGFSSDSEADVRALRFGPME